jgi:hypothetical protein
MIPPYQEFRVIYEVVTAILCFILVWYMMKPYRFTRMKQYVGLPLAFGLLGASYLFSAVIYALPSFFHQDMMWFQLVARTFAFIFLSATYYFSKKQSMTSQLLWKVTFSLIVVAILMSIIAVLFIPQSGFEDYRVASSYTRIFIMISLSYVTISALKSHLNKPDSTTLFTPFGYILLAISQYSLVIWAADASMIAFWGALALRGGGLAILFLVAYVTFHNPQGKRMHK